MKFKGKLALLLAVVITVAAIVPTMVAPVASAAAKETITYKMFVNDPTPAATDDNKIYKLIEKEFGIKFDIESIVGDANQRYGIMIASGDYPDLIACDEKLITAKVAIPLNTYVNKFKNIKDYVQPYMKQLTYDKNGELYCIPNWGRIYGKAMPYYNGNGFWIQKDVLAEAGYPKVRTLDQMFDIVQKYVKKHPTIEGKPTIGYSFLTYDWRSFCMKNAPATVNGYPNDGGVVVDWNTHKAKLYANSSQMAMPYYKKLNQMNAAGILDRETFTDNYDQYMAKVSSGRVLAKYAAQWQDASAEDALKKADKDNRTYVCMPVTLNTKIVDHVLEATVINKNRGMVISKTCKNPERVMEFMDGILTDKWQKIFQWGIEGQDYKMVKGEPVRTETQRTQQEDATWKNSNRALALANMIPHHSGQFSDGTFAAITDNKTESMANQRPFDRKMLNAYKVTRYEELLTPIKENLASYPAWNIDLISGSAAAKADTKISDLQVKWIPRVVLAKTANFSKEWNSYMAAFRNIKNDVAAYEKRINDEVAARFKLLQ